MRARRRGDGQEVWWARLGAGNGGDAVQLGTYLGWRRRRHAASWRVGKSRDGTALGGGVEEVGRHRRRRWRAG